MKKLKRKLALAIALVMFATGSAAVTSAYATQGNIPVMLTMYAYAGDCTFLTQAVIEFTDDINNIEYNGEPCSPGIRVSLGDKVLTENTDYTVTYLFNKDAGTAYCRIKAAEGSGYAGQCSRAFTIRPFTISDAKCTFSQSGFAYNGKNMTPKVTVKGPEPMGNPVLEEGRDYTVSYNQSSRKNVGTYTVTVTGKGNFSGSRILSFRIEPAATKITRLAAGKKEFAISWARKAAQVTGYQIRYSTSSRFSSYRTVKISSCKTASKTVRNLKAGKKYYVKVRTYKMVSGKTYYSDWSPVKQVTVKKQGR